jgi:hypothetical protein
MTIGELVLRIQQCGHALQRRAIEHGEELTLEQFHALEVTVRAHDSWDDHDFCGNLESVDVDFTHDDDDTPYLALDCGNEEA